MDTDYHQMRELMATAVVVMSDLQQKMPPPHKYILKKESIVDDYYYYIHRSMYEDDHSVATAAESIALLDVQPATYFFVLSVCISCALLLWTVAPNGSRRQIK